MNKPTSLRRFIPCLGLVAALGLTLLGGCSGLLPKAAPPPSAYALDGMPEEWTLKTRVVASDTAPTLIVNPTRAAPGFDSRHIVYVRVAHQLEHFAHSDWVDTPAHMLTPLIVSATETAGSFRAVGVAPSGITGDLRLDTEILRLQQDFGDMPSHVRFTLRATLSDVRTRQVISWREFDQTVLSRTEDPYGGVVAANLAVRLVIQQLGRFCILASEPWWNSHRPEQKNGEPRLH